MKLVVVSILLCSVFISSLFSCKKKTEDPKDAVVVATDSVYSYAKVDGLNFTGSTTDATYYHGDNPYLVFHAETGPASNHKIISFRIDNFLNKPGEFVIGDSTDVKASYSTNDSTVEVAYAGKIIITSMEKSVRGTFYFTTEHHSILSGSFSAQ
jgi:hypothetical protein